MQVVKDQVIKLIKTLPNNVTVDDIMEELYFKMQVDKGLEELDRGKGIDHAQAVKRLSKWLKK